MGKVTKSGQNNITSPAGNSLAVFVDGKTDELKLKDIKGNIEPLSNYVGGGGNQNLQEVVDNGNTIAVPDIASQKAMQVTLGGVGTINNPDAFVVINQGRESVGEAGLIGSFVTSLRNKDNVGFYSEKKGTGGEGFTTYIHEDSDESGSAYTVRDFSGNVRYNVDELGNLNAKKLSITGGTPDQYLKADGTTSGGNAPITVSKTQLDALVLANGLIVGTLYEITGVNPDLYNDGTNSGTTIYLQAITNNTLSQQGNGIFYNPKYDQTIEGFGIWNNRSSWVATQSNLSILGTTGINPKKITIDVDGNIYTANSGSNNVTKITPLGVSTILGTTGSYPQGITIDSLGNIYTSNYFDSNVTKITPLGVSTTLGTTGANPTGITIDSLGNVYTSNYNDNNVTKITPLGLSTIHGTTGDKPTGITIDSLGNVYTSNGVSNNVTKITPLNVSTILGTTGTSPQGITIDSLDNIYTANEITNNVTKITPLGVSTIHGTTGASPDSIITDIDGNVYVCNVGSQNITKISPFGIPTTITLPSQSRGIVLDASGAIYASITGLKYVVKIINSAIIPFVANEAVTANNGATGQLFATLESNLFIAITGDWTTATSITGDSSLATATISTVVLQSYAINSKVLWGGYSWTNLDGNIGTNIDILNLDPLVWHKDVYGVSLPFVDFTATILTPLSSNLAFIPNKTGNFKIDVWGFIYDASGDADTQVDVPMGIGGWPTSWTITLVETGEILTFDHSGNFVSRNTIFLGGYNKVVDVIEYDYSNDWISRRYEVEANNDVVFTKQDSNYFFLQSYNYSAISVFMFGNKYDSSLFLGVGNNKVFNSYFESVDFMGGSIYENSLNSNSRISENAFTGASTIAYNTLLNQSVIQGNILTNGNNKISANLLNGSNIQSNILMFDSYIENNINNISFIESNVLNWATISNNELYSSSIQFNNIKSATQITDNKLTSSFIENNFTMVNMTIGGGGITTNILSGNSYIRNNSFDNGVIQFNTLSITSKIEDNSLISCTISSNVVSNYSLINLNTTYNSLITSNTLSTYSHITSNIANTGLIEQNVLEVQGIIQTNSITSSNVSHNRILSNRNSDTGIIDNVLTGGSNIIYNIINISDNVDYGIKLNVMDGSSISWNILNLGLIYSNTLPANNAIDTNVLNNDSFISLNTLNSDSYIEKNTLNKSSIRLNALTNSGISINSLTNSIINVGILNPMLTKVISFLTMDAGKVLVDISLATVIYAIYPRTVYVRPDGVFKIRYYNDSDVLVIVNITD